jgi:hypothetical protein
LAVRNADHQAKACVSAIDGQAKQQGRAYVELLGLTILIP